MLTTKEVSGIKVLKAPGKRGKVGKISRSVFSPDGTRVVGFIVKRPDALMMVKREDRFLALDAIDEQDGCFVPTMGKDSWDEAAIKRLGLDWDRCIIWEGMDIRTQAGDELGRVGSLVFNTKTGEIASLMVNDGATSQALLGVIEIPAQMLIGYQDGFLVVENEAAKLKASGGAAAKAGEAAALATKNITIASEKGKIAVQKGSYELGKALGKVKKTATQATEKTEQKAESTGEAIGKHLKKTGGMFAAFKEEFDKASKED